ncbi:hypothetical protein HOLleu_23660 [Holothuria leucospilota]|uniref:Uncharacterized protein n=1 Tax=Holothuria leucospilota TaxID=206669 RepID=A0A9Q1BVJ2_HOLLE|nr:hypothetical protein HOLleu_23660 [Holothuria leucospilota]
MAVSLPRIYVKHCVGQILIIYFALRAAGAANLDEVSTRQKRDTEGSWYFCFQRPHYPRDCQEVNSYCSMTEVLMALLQMPQTYPAQVMFILLNLMVIQNRLRSIVITVLMEGDGRYFSGD